jgi:hypothetical protein
MTLQEQNNSTNKSQTCSSCYKILPIELYFNDKNSKPFRTCFHCRTKQQRKSKRMQESDSVEPVAQFTNLDEFLDFYSELLEEFIRNGENVHDSQINIACTIDSSLFIGLPKEIANEIVKQVSEVDDYSWK